MIQPPLSRQSSHLAIAAAMALGILPQANADIFDTNSTTAGFGVTNGTTYDWWTTSFWSDGTVAANDAGTAATVTWQGTSLVSEQAYFIGSGTAGENYTVRLGATGATDTYIQNMAINVLANGSAAAPGAAGDVTIGNAGDAGKLIIRASNSVGAQNGATLTINNGININALTLNFRGGKVVINGVVSGTGASKIAFGSGAFGLSSGTLTLANTANTYAGRASTDYINANYTLAVTKLADGGSNSSIGTSSANIGINGGTLKYIGDTGSQSTNLGLNIGSSGAFFSADGATSTDTISITGAPTYSAANSARTITLTGANAGDNTMGFVFNNNGTGVNVLTKTLGGRWIVNQANGYTGGTNANGGTLVAANTGAFGAAGRTINFSTGTVEFATDTTANAYVLNVGSGNTGTVTVNRATSAATMTHTMGTATLGNGTLNIQKGANVSGVGTLEFGGITMTAGATGLSTGTLLNPTTANVLVSGNITRTGSLANLLTLDGTSNGNLISGIISGPQALTKSNLSTWELSNANTFTGRTLVTGGTLKLTNNLALQSSAFDTSGAGSLDLTDASITTLTLGGLTGDAITGQDLVLPSNVTGLTLNPAGTVTYLKNISGGAVGLTLIKTGAGTQVLGGTNTYSGLTTVSAGELNVTNGAALGSTSGVTVASGAQFTMDGGITITGKSITTSGSGRASGVGAFVGGLQSVSGVNEWAGSVVIGADASRIGARKNATLVVSGGIDDGANTYHLLIRNESFGSGTNGAGNADTITVLSGASTYGGNTQLIHGLTKLDGGDNRLPIGTILQFGLATTNAKFDMNGRNQEVAGLAVTSTTTDANRDWNANELTNSSGTLSKLTVNTTADQSFGGTLTNNVGIITGNITVEKSGSAKLTLSGANTYTGNTTVAAGVLALAGSGSISSSAVVNIASGATFDIQGVSAGNYTLGGGAVPQTLSGGGATAGQIDATGKTLIMGSNATLQPGNSAGTLAVTGNLQLSTGTTLNWELNPGDTTVGGAINDLVTVGGLLTLAGNLNVTGGDFSSLTSGTWRLFQYGTLSYTPANLTLASTPTLGSGYFWEVQNDTVNSAINLTIVPEPSVALLGLLGASGWVLRRRRPTDAA